MATTKDATAYNVADGRGFEEATDLLHEDFDGVVVRDGWAPYCRYTKATHQTCVAHLLRRCDELVADLPAGFRQTPRQVSDILGQALAARDLDEAGRAEVVEDLAERVELLAHRGPGPPRVHQAGQAPPAGGRRPVHLSGPPRHRRHQLAG